MKGTLITIGGNFDNSSFTGKKNDFSANNLVNEYNYDTLKITRR